MRISRLRVMLVGTSIVMAFIIVSLVGASPAKAQASDGCPLDTTVQSLQICVQYAADQGFIDNQGVANSFLAKLGAAQNAVNRNQPDVAINQLQAFIQEVQAQAGKHIDAMHAEHMVAHAQAVVQALKEPS